MEKTVACGNCHYEGSAVEFSYVALAGGKGPGTLLRCPACRELVIVEGYALSDDNAPERAGFERDQGRGYIRPG